MPFMKRNLPLFLAFAVCILITVFSSGIPLFWDSVYYALPAIHGDKLGFHPFHVYEAYDTGGFPFYASVLYLAWKFLGVTHYLERFIWPCCLFCLESALRFIALPGYF
jgi:hypothetical protein